MTKEAVYSTGSSLLVNPLDVYKEIKRKNIETANVEGQKIMSLSHVAGGAMSGTSLDVMSWLPFASKNMQLSGNIEDYVIVPVVTINTDLPNRNAVGFPKQRLVAWNAERGMQAYKTFKGQPTFYNHKNNVLSEAKGVILDSAMHKMQGYGGGKVWKVVELLSFDRTKDSDIVKSILTGELNSYSMGAYVDGYTCSYCGAELGKCSHLNVGPNSAKQVQFYELNGKLVFKNVAGDVSGFETSVVDEPAYVSAVSDVILKR